MRIPFRSTRGTKKPRTGVSGTADLNGLSGKDFKAVKKLVQERGAKLFASIVKNAGTVTTKRRLGVSNGFVSIKTRGKAVAIGPLEYCGNDIPMKESHGATL